MNCLRERTGKRGIFTLVLALFLVLLLFPVRVNASGSAASGNSETLRFEVTQKFTVTGTAPDVSTLAVKYTLTPQGDNAAQAPMPAGTQNGEYTFTLAGTDVSHTIEIAYSQIGTYLYELKPVNEGKENYVYDTQVYTLSVQAYNHGSGLKFIYVPTRADGDKAPALDFTNQYKGPSSSGNNGGGGNSGGGGGDQDADTTENTPAPTTTGTTTTAITDTTDDTAGEEEETIGTDTGDEIQDAEAEGELPDGQQDVQNRESEGKAGDGWSRLAWLLLGILLVLFLLILGLLFGIALLDGAMAGALGAGWFIIFAKLSRDYRRGDVVVLKQEEYGRLVRRIIGMPGETVRINSSTGQVFIEDEPLEEPYVIGKTSCKDQRYSQITLGEDEYFVMGDKREESIDSRTFGAIQESKLKGRALTTKHHKFDR